RPHARLRPGGRRPARLSTHEGVVGPQVFTGLVQGMGRITALDRTGDGARLTIETPLVTELRSGDSVAVNGVCLTATALQNSSFVADAMNETLSRSSLGGLEDGARVNL